MELSCIFIRFLCDKNNVPCILFSAHSQAGSDEEDESEDEDYQPQKDEDWKKVG